MRLSILVTAAVMLTAGSVQAGYDKSWYITEYWSGEWPNGFAVVAPNVVVPARSVMDKEEPPSISCALPYKAMFHPWNVNRNQQGNVRYVTASKIVPLVARADFAFQPDDGSTPIPIAKGQVIEYLIYGAEGFFTVRIDGKEYTAEQGLFDSVEPVADDAFVQEEWLHLRCENAKRAWIYVNDLMQTGEDGQTAYAVGLRAASGGEAGIEEYGLARDLTDEEVAAGAEQADPDAEPMATEPMASEPTGGEPAGEPTDPETSAEPTGAEPNGSSSSSF
jgi:hypothetical protein